MFRYKVLKTETQLRQQNVDENIMTIVDLYNFCLQEKSFLLHL